MNDELHAAAERLRRVRGGGDPLVVYGMFAKSPKRNRATYEFEAIAQVEQDEETLADAYLDEHPADDEEPITTAWLRSVGLRCNTTSRNSGRSEVWHVIYDLPGSAVLPVLAEFVPTRQRVRMVAQGLGITLAENARVIADFLDDCWERGSPPTPEEIEPFLRPKVRELVWRQANTHHRIAQVYDDSYCIIDDGTTEGEPYYWYAEQHYGSGRCTTLELAQAAAQAHWHERAMAFWREAFE